MAKIGFTAIQLSPVHPPSMQTHGEKLGSAYAPRDHGAVGRHLWDPKLSHDAYLQTGKQPFLALARSSELLETPGPQALADGLNSRGGAFANLPEYYQQGWRSLRELTTFAGQHGLKVVGDIVLAHTARDGDTLALHQGMFGNDVYLRTGSEIQTPGSHDHLGRYDPWHDVAPIDLTGPAAMAVGNYYLMSLGLFLEAGVNVFRADSAVRILPFWETGFIESSRLFADRLGLQRPAFYAETQGTWNAEQDIRVLIGHGFDGVTNAFAWWDLAARWHIDQLRATWEAGGLSVSFASSHDTAPFAGMSPAAREQVARLVMTATLSGVFTMLAGTLSGSTQKPSVFLPEYQPQAPGGPSPDEGQGSLRGMMISLLALKGAHPILGMTTYTQMTQDGKVVFFHKATESEEAVIAYNPQPETANFAVEPDYRNGLAFYAFVDSDGKIRYGDGPSGPVNSYSLAPGGIAVFAKRLQPGRTSIIPPRSAPPIDAPRGLRLQP
ncbi:MAG: hypothetical protein V2A66_01205 [Pseudomonadota bacterium]